MRSKARNPSDHRSDHRSDLAEDVCEAIKALTAQRTSRSYAAQWVMASDVRRRVDADGAQFAASLRFLIERYRIKAVGEPAHSISLIYGWDEK